MQRVDGDARVRFALSGGITRLADLYQRGSAKIRLPKVYGTAATAVLINTAGGLTGGDRLAYDIRADAGAHAILTSQTAERAYRSAGGFAEVTGSFTVGDGATLEWLPQETILFEASGLRRSLRADLAGDARLMMIESVLLGRKAMGETVRSIFFRDSWRLHREGRLVFADDIRLDGDPARSLSGPATAAGCLAVSTFVDCTPDAGDRIDMARRLLAGLPEGTATAATSAWNGVLVARFVSVDGRGLRTALTQFLTGYRAAPLPRVWSC
jgi:urease accessory protein